MFPLGGLPVNKGRRIIEAVCSAVLLLCPPAMASGLYDSQDNMVIGYSLKIDNMHIGDLVVTINTTQQDMALTAYVESRGLLSMLKPAVYYYAYQGDTFQQISVGKKRYKRYQYIYGQPLNSTLSPVVKTIGYDNGKGGELSPIDDRYKAGHTFLSLVGAVIKNTPVTNEYSGCPEALQKTPIKLFTAKGQSEFVISGDTLPITDLKGDGASIFKPAYGCGWTLKHLYGDKKKSDYYQGSQTWFANFGDDRIFPLYHRTKNKDGSVEIELLGVQELGQVLYGEMPVMAQQGKYKTLWDRVNGYKNQPYPQ